MKKILFTVIFALSFAATFAREFPDEYYTLRDAMYNFEKPAAEIENEANSAMQKARQSISGYDLNIALARYEYIIGRAYSYDKNREKAAAHFDKGMEFAKAAIDIKESAQSHLIYAENISGNCASKSFAWVVAWGPKVGGIAKKALKLDSKNGALLYMQYAQDIYAPRMFSNYKRGIKEMSALLDNPAVVLDTDDEFNIKSAIGYAQLKLGNTAEAQTWLKKSLEIYPNNKFVKNLLETNSAEDVVASE